MHIENDYYILTDVERQELSGRFQVRLRSDCDVYRGHFPGRPICPGVFTLQTVKECAEKLAACPLRLGDIKRCRFLALATPQQTPVLEICVTLSSSGGTYGCKATVADGERCYMDFEGELLP